MSVPVGEALYNGLTRTRGVVQIVVTWVDGSQRRLWRVAGADGAGMTDWGLQYNLNNLI